MYAEMIHLELQIKFKKKTANNVNVRFVDNNLFIAAERGEKTFGVLFVRPDKTDLKCK
jgi:hypothetical protein